MSLKNSTPAVVAALKTRDGYKVYTEKPPSHYNPRKSYVPKVGEWFWRKWPSDGWQLRMMMEDGAYYRESYDGAPMKKCSWDNVAYKGICLPATDPTK
ncbi:hypothetical protein LCGC14_2372770 [marine sediment metagenome]|uniref:Uncharacterized protein n=1 Tax=marine sediment metagenome TaxID=412755 RepID=A0A0F9EXV2_9ZZZZ